MAHPYWPLFDFRVRTPRIELRFPDDDDIVELTALVESGIHDPAFMPFSTPWSAVASPQRERDAMRHYWFQRGRWRADDWTLALAAVVEGEVVGTQSVSARNFARLRTVESGSWLGRRHQGKGIGKEMRAAMLHLVFEGLGAQYAMSAAYEDNHPSIGVSRALGYEDNGIDIAERQGRADRQLRFLLTRERWEQHRTVDVTIEDLEPSLVLFGLAPDLSALDGASGHV